MKKLFFASLSLVVITASAQNRQIEFEHGNWASVLEKAKKEKKYIFVDAYTTWCGPCKWLAKSIFTNDTVADHYNANFVNYKLDMEKGEGIAFAKKYDIHCFPTLLFIDSNDNLINRSAGAPGVKGMIEYAKESMTPSKTFPVRKKELEAAGINETNGPEYIQLLSGNCFDASAAVTTYMTKVKSEDLMKDINWDITERYINDPSSREIKHLMANKTDYEKKFGAERIAIKLDEVGAHYFDDIMRQDKPDLKAYEQKKKDFIALKWPNSEKILFTADLHMARSDMSKYYSIAASGYLKHYYNDANSLNSMAWDFYKNVSDRSQLGAAIKMAERACELSPGYANLDTYAAVLYKHGDYKDAEKFALQAIEAAKKSGEDYKETEDLLKQIRLKIGG